jgi:hypothetical protein
MNRDARIGDFEQNKDSEFLHFDSKQDCDEFVDALKNYSQFGFRCCEGLGCQMRIDRYHLLMNDEDLRQRFAPQFAKLARQRSDTRQTNDAMQTNDTMQTSDTRQTNDTRQRQTNDAMQSEECDICGNAVGLLVSECAFESHASCRPCLLKIKRHFTNCAFCRQPLTGTERVVFTNKV